MIKHFLVFNYGSKYNPHLSEAIQEGLANKNKPYAKGFVEGVIECYKEQGIEKRIDRNRDQGE